MKNIDPDEVCHRLKLARQAAGYKSARKFSLEHEISAATYFCHETGKRALRPAQIKKYAYLLGVNHLWLLAGIGQPFNHDKTDTQLISGPKLQELLNYQGNPAVRGAVITPSTLENVDPLLFCKIVKNVLNKLASLNTSLPIDFITKKVVEIYYDITNTNATEQSHDAMINLEMSMFARELEKKTNKNLTMVKK